MGETTAVDQEVQLVVPQRKSFLEYQQIEEKDKVGQFIRFRIRRSQMITTREAVSFDFLSV